MHDLFLLSSVMLQALCSFFRIEKTIIQVLPCFWRMNQYLARNGLKQFAVLPVAKHFVNGHIQMDTTVMDLFLNGALNDYDNLRKRSKKRKTKDETRSTADYVKQVWLHPDNASYETAYKTEMWESIFHLPRHNPEKVRFSGSITTNGVEVSFHFVTKPHASSFKKQEDKVVCIGKNGLYKEGKTIIDLEKDAT